MNTPDRFDRHVERLLADLTGSDMPPYIDDALAIASARPQRRPSILARLGLDGTGPRLRSVLIGVPVVLAVSVAFVGILLIGRGPTVTSSPSPVPTAPSSAPISGPITTPAPTAIADLETCDGFARAVDARIVDAVGESPWETEKGPPPAISTLRGGAIAGLAERLASGRAVVLVDSATGIACRLIDLEPDTDLWDLQWSRRGDALAMAVGHDVLVWSAIGLTRVHQVPDTGYGVTVAWSPTGESLAVGSSSSSPITVVFSDGSRRDVALAKITSIAWAPDGTRFAAAGWTPSLDVVSSDGLTIDPLEARDGLIGWLDAQTIVAPAPGLTGALDAFDVRTGTLQPWAPAPTESVGLTNVIGYAPGMTMYAYFANDSIDQLGDPMDLIVRDLPSSTRRVLADNLVPPNFASATGMWSPDSTHIAISVVATPGDPMVNPGLWIYAAVGGEPTFVSAPEISLYSGSWQPLP